MPPCRSERATAADPRHENARKRTIVLKVGDEDEPWSLVLSMCIACSSTEGVLHSNHSTTMIDRTDKLGLSGLSRNGPVLLQPAAEKGPELLQPVLVVHERLRQAAKAEADALDDLRVVTPQLQQRSCRKPSGPGWLAGLHAIRTGAMQRCCGQRCRRTEPLLVRAFCQYGSDRIGSDPAAPAE